MWVLSAVQLVLVALVVLVAARWRQLRTHLFGPLVLFRHRFLDHHSGEAFRERALRDIVLPRGGREELRGSLVEVFVGDEGERDRSSALLVQLPSVRCAHAVVGEVAAFREEFARQHEAEALAEQRVDLGGDVLIVSSSVFVRLGWMIFIPMADYYQRLKQLAFPRKRHPLGSNSVEVTPDIAHIMPSQQQHDRLLRNAVLSNSSIAMFNFLRLSPVHPVEYTQYGMLTCLDLLPMIRGRVVFIGATLESVQWDSLAIMHYPSRAEFLMLEDFRYYHKLHKYRVKGLRSTVMTVCVPDSGSRWDTGVNPLHKKHTERHHAVLVDAEREDEVDNHVLAHAP